MPKLRLISGRIGTDRNCQKRTPMARPVSPPSSIYVRYPYSACSGAIMTSAPYDAHLSQLDKFKAAAKGLETDDDEARFDERVKELARHKPVPGGIETSHVELK